MFKIIDVEQGEDDWFEARLGKWTASQFSKAITNTGKPSASANNMNNRLVAELILGEQDETFQSEAMQRGTDLESRALSYLNFTYDYNFKSCGFMESEEGYGCSPDALDLGAKIGLELKCPMAHNHISYLAGGVLPKQYKAQVQGSLLVSGFKQWVFCSYHPEIKPFIIFVDRDEEYIEKLRKELISNTKKVKEGFEKISKLVEE